MARKRSNWRRLSPTLLMRPTEGGSLQIIKGTNGFALYFHQTGVPWRPAPRYFPIARRRSQQGDSVFAVRCVTYHQGDPNGT